MKKSEVIDLIKHQISGGDLTSDLLSRYGEQFIEKYVELAYTSIIYALQVAATKAGDYGQLDPYIKTFKNVPVICDEDRDEYYSELPCAVIPLPMARGIRMISPMRGQGVDFIYRENNTANIYDELECGMTADYVTFYPENSKVFYGNLKDITKVLMKLLPTFSAWDDDDEIPLPAGQDMELVAKVAQLLEAAPQEDLKDDSKAEAEVPRKVEKEK